MPRLIPFVQCLRSTRRSDLRFYSVVALLLAFWLMPTSIRAQEQGAKASIEGIVLKAGTTEPIAGAQLTYVDPEKMDGSKMSINADSQGKFRIANLNAGFFGMTVAANGYAKQSWPDDRREQGPIKLAAGQNLKNIAVGLVPAGVVSGIIRDEMDQPAVGVQVQLLRPSYNFDGRRDLFKTRAVTTDDRGQYRLFNVTPGRYYLTASTIVDRSTLRRTADDDPNTVPQNYALSYYPGGGDSKSASIIEVRPGSDLTADFSVQRQEYFKIRGIVVDSRTGTHPAAATIWIEGENSGSSSVLVSTKPSYNPTDGTFEFRDVPPGSYVVSAHIPEPAKSAPNGRPAGASDGIEIPTADMENYKEPPRALTRVTVSKSIVDGVLLNIVGPASISGRLTLEGQELSTIQDFSQIRFKLFPLDFDAVQSTPSFKALNPDGTFRIDNVMPGQYRVIACIGIPGCARETPEFYLKYARFDSTDVLTSPLQFPGGAPSMLDIVLGPKPGQIDGTVMNDKQQPVAHTPVVLIPDQDRARFDHYYFATSDAAGHFIMRGITPGGYKVFAWEDLEDNAFFDSDVLQPYDSLGKPVRLAESDKRTIDVKLIPSPH